MKFQAVPRVNNVINFKSIKQTENGANYHKTNAGTITGCVVGTLAGIHWGTMKFNAKNTDLEFLKKLGVKTTDIEALKKVNQYFAKNAIPFGIIAAGLSIGCGVLIDKMRNNRSKEIANQIAEQGAETTFKINSDTAVNNAGFVYHNSNIGKKWGALLGAACGIVH